MNFYLKNCIKIFLLNNIFLFSSSAFAKSDNMSMINELLEKNANEQTSKQNDNLLLEQAIPKQTNIQNPQVVESSKSITESTDNFPPQPNLDKPQTEEAKTSESSALTPTSIPPLADCIPSSISEEFGIKHYKFPEVKLKDLVTIEGIKVHKDMVNNLKEMLKSAKIDGVTLKVGSGFRSLAYQQQIIDRKKKQKQSPKEIYYVSSPVGYSEHHTGFAIDFIPINPSFGKDKKGNNTKPYTWLLANASKYGFSQTYTTEVSDKNGIAEENWHWKYNASPLAKEMLINDFCYSYVPNSIDDQTKSINEAKMISNNTQEN